MKSLVFAIVLNLSMVLGLTACSTEAKKTEAPKATEEKVAAAAPAPKAIVTKSTTATKKADKATAPAAAPAATSASANATTCTHGADIRSLALSSSGTGCELTYTKNGDAKSIASAKNESTFCAGVSEKIVKNLTAAGFSCK